MTIRASGTNSTADDLEVTASAYEAAAKSLREAVRILRSGPAARSVSANGTPAAAAATETPASGKTRHQQLSDWLRKHGPATRRTIKESINIPAGTLASLLTTKNYDRDANGKWSAKEEEVTE